MNKIPDSWLPFAVKPMTQEEYSAFLLSGYVKPQRVKKTLSEEERAIQRAKNNALRNAKYAALTPEQLSARRAKNNEHSAKYYAEGRRKPQPPLSEEQRAKSKERSAKYFAALSPEQLATHRAKKLEADKKCRVKSKAQIAPPPEEV